ncbi:hypothetical protein FOZ60_012891 [Perkinsus olseni]|uniref:Uncharacterized protein n=1 Tax=Perkinsus olseni TaxID=32597 RepID=A0A7J6NAB5_PEROL|nr:hypothetical protein FOZ60_012891 [Perkinsus olseni]
MLHLIVLSAAALVIAGLAKDEHAWLVPSSGTAFDDSSEYIDEGGLGGMKNESGLPGPYDRPTGTCALSSYDVIGCHCKRDEVPRGVQSHEGLLAIVCTPPCDNAIPCDYRRVLKVAGGLRSLNVPSTWLSCATPEPYGTVCWCGSCFVTPHGDDCPPGMQAYTIVLESTRVCMYPI